MAYFKKILSVVLALAVLVLGFACRRVRPKDDAPPEAPGIRVQWGEADIDWVLGLNQWNGSADDREDTFRVVLGEAALAALPYIPNGEEIHITFDRDLPDTVELMEYILREDGDMQYNLGGMPYELTNFDRFLSTSFRIEPNWATLLSSDSADYAPGAVIKGYRLICYWAEHSCEYGFVIRGDAAVLMQQEPDEVAEEPIRAVNWQRVYPNGDGMAFVLEHCDDPTGEGLPVVHFNDRAALDTYIAAGDGLFGFASIFAQYDDDFFAAHRLIVIYARENSGSVRHELASWAIDGDSMEIFLRRNRPQIGTADMLDCFIILECAAVGEFAGLQSFSAFYEP